MSKEEILEAIKGMSVLELNDLVKAIEERVWCHCRRSCRCGRSCRSWGSCRGEVRI